MVAAVLEKHARLKIAANDVYLSTVGGMRLTDPSADLAVAIALASAYVGLPLPATAVMIGEVGLAGDLRRVSGMERRLAEAARQGFTTALIPPSCGAAPAGLQALEAATIVAALEHMLNIAEHRSNAPVPHRLDGTPA
jgi:DNA repair protein RadA/Sms